MPCDDGVDNDADGLADFPNDFGCTSLLDPNELRECNDGLDNDGDTLVDGQDPECAASGVWWNSESEPRPACGLGFEVALVAGVLGLRRRVF